MKALLAGDFTDTEPYSTSYLFSSQDVSKRSEGGSDDEDFLATRGPIQRLLYMTLGPLICQIVLSVYGLADSMWVSKTLGIEETAVFGAVYIVEFLGIAVSEYFMTGLSARASFLFGTQDLRVECNQMFVDFIRISFIAGAILPAIVLPITRPLIEWFEGGKDFSAKCFTYMIPGSAGCCFKFIYMIVCGQAQAEGRSMVFAGIQLGALVLNQLVFDPIFLLWWKFPVWGASLGRICGEGTMGLIGCIIIFAGKFSIKPKLGMFCKKFSRQTWVGMKVGFAAFISVCSETLPMVLMQKFVNTAATEIGEYEVLLEVWSMIEKLYQLVGGICVAFSLGLLPCLAYSYGAGHYKDCLALTLHGLWITTLIASGLSLLLMFIPDKVSSLWSTDPDFLRWIKIMVPKVFYMAPLLAMLYIVPVLYEGMQKYVASTVMSILMEFLPLPIFSCIVYYTDPKVGGKRDPARIMWAYCLNDGYAFLICTGFLIPQIIKFVKAPRTLEEIADAQKKGKRRHSDARYEKTTLVYTEG